MRDLSSTKFRIFLIQRERQTDPCCEGVHIALQPLASFLCIEGKKKVKADQYRQLFALSSSFVAFIVAGQLELVQPQQPRIQISRELNIHAFMKGIHQG